MTDLTEQWEKGKLPTGTYWLKTACTRFPEVGYYVSIDGKVDFYKKSDGFRTKNVLAVEKVLSKVPSYDEWEALIDLYKEADVIIKKSDKENTKLKTDCRIIAQKLLQVKSELREWLEVNYKEYL